MVGGEKHECYRECRTGEHRECYYTFLVSQYTAMSYTCGNCPVKLEDCYAEGCITGGGNTRPVAVVNHMVPGPSIQVCEDDTIRVHVINGFSSESTSIHWHGLHQVGTQLMDGTPYITQCPILPGNEFIYRFKASPAGTHIWHAHVAFQDSDGLYSSLIVRKPNDPLQKYYDFDLAEHVMVIWHWFDTATAFRLKTALDTFGSVHGYGLTVNGRGAHVKFSESGKAHWTPRETFHVDGGKRYRFRVIFNTAIYCPVQVAIDDHKMLIVGSETGIFDPVEVDTMILNGGERYDFVLITDKPPGNYWIRYRALGDCHKDDVHVAEAAILHYNEVPQGEPTGSVQYEDNYRSGVLFNPLSISTESYENNSLIRVVDLNNSAPTPPELFDTPNHTFYFKFSFNTYESHFDPGPYPQINDLSFENPSTPFLSQREDLTQSMYCTPRDLSSQHCHSGYCRCPLIYPIEHNALVEMVFVDESDNRDQDHPMHLHGHDFYVVAMENVGDNVSLEAVRRRNELGEIPKKFNNSVLKDGVSVPVKGYAVIRFFASNPGYWLFHCHLVNHMEMGMTFAIKVGEHSDMPRTPRNFPRCGHFILEEDVDDSRATGVKCLSKPLSLLLIIFFLYEFTLI
ncbi:uncharacterized protein LOC135165467 isoform X2 [Diachasmimorpha longicaudata]